MKRSLVLIALPALLAVGQIAQAQTASQSSVYAIGDGSTHRILNSGPGSSTSLDHDGDYADINIESHDGARTRVFSHGNAQVSVQNYGEDLTVVAGANCPPERARITRRLGFAILTCH